MTFFQAYKSSIWAQERLKYVLKLYDEIGVFKSGKYSIRKIDHDFVYITQSNDYSYTHTTTGGLFGDGNTETEWVDSTKTVNFKLPYEWFDECHEDILIPKMREYIASEKIRIKQEKIELDINKKKKELQKLESRKGGLNDENMENS